MQVNIKNICHITESTNLLNKFSEQIETIYSEKITQELNLSNNFLSVAKVSETQKLSILAQKEAQLTT